MNRFNIMLRTAYVTINLCIILCNSHITTSQLCNSGNGTNKILPLTWPCQWNDGVIPFVFNFYSLSGLKRLTSHVKRGLRYLEERSCLVFKEYNPVEIAKKKNYTYLYYSYSEVLESCCLPLFSKPIGRRLILITPICTLPAEVGHATLHGLGLTHPRHEAFSERASRQLLFLSNRCPDVKQKMKTFNSRK